MPVKKTAPKKSVKAAVKPAPKAKPVVKTAKAVAKTTTKPVKAAKPVAKPKAPAAKSVKATKVSKPTPVASKVEAKVAKAKKAATPATTIQMTADVTPEVIVPPAAEIDVVSPPSTDAVSTSDMMKSPASSTMPAAMKEDFDALLKRAISRGYVTQEEVLEYTEAMFINLVTSLYPEKKISQIPFPRISYSESIEKYGSDKPDMRVNKEDPNELAFAWVLDFPMFEKTDDGSLQAVHHPFCSIKEEDKEKFMTGTDLFSIRANAYDLVLNGYELSSGSIRIHERDVQKQVFKPVSYTHLTLPTNREV